MSCPSIRGARPRIHLFSPTNLIQQLNVLENIEMPLFYQGYSEGDSHEIAMGASSSCLVLDDRVDHKTVLNSLAGSSNA